MNPKTRVRPLTISIACKCFTILLSITTVMLYTHSRINFRKWVQHPISELARFNLCNISSNFELLWPSCKVCKAIRSIDNSSRLRRGCGVHSFSFLFNEHTIGLYTPLRGADVFQVDLYARDFYIFFNERICAFVSMCLMMVLRTSYNPVLLKNKGAYQMF